MILGAVEPDAAGYFDDMLGVVVIVVVDG